MAEVKVTRDYKSRDRLRDLDAGVRTGIINAGVFYINTVKRTFQLFSPRGHASGNLIRSLTVSPVKLVGGVYRSRVGPGQSAPYALYVHQGTGPAAGHGPRRPPPTDKIYEWVKEKGLVPTFTTVPAKTGRSGGPTRRSRRKVDIERDRRALAFLIARSIGKKGTKPFPFLTGPFRAVKADMERIIVDSILRSLRR